MTSPYFRVVTVRESQGEKGLFHTVQGKSGNLKKVREESQKERENFAASFFSVKYLILNQLSVPLKMYL